MLEKDRLRRVEEWLTQELNFDQGEFERLSQKPAKPANLVRKSQVDSLFLVDFDEFVGDSAALDELKLQLQLRRKLAEEGPDEAQMLSEEEFFLAKLSSTHSRALEQIKQLVRPKAQSSDLAAPYLKNHDLVARILSSRSLLKAAKLGLLHFDRQLSMRNSYRSLFVDSMMVLAQKKVLKVESKMFEALKADFDPPKETDFQRLEKIFAKLAAPKEVLEVFAEELEKLSKLNEKTAEYFTSLNYLDTLALLPFGTTTPECLDVKRVQRVLGRRNCRRRPLRTRRHKGTRAPVHRLGQTLEFHPGENPLPARPARHRQNLLCLFRGPGAAKEGPAHFARRRKPGDRAEGAPQNLHQRQSRQNRARADRLGRRKLRNYPG